MSKTWYTCIVLPQFYVPTHVVHNNLSKHGPGTSLFPHESCWRHHRCKDQLPWSSGKIQYLLLKLLTVKELATQKDCWQSEKIVVHVVFQFVRVFMQFHFLQQELCAMQLHGCMFAKVHRRGYITRPHPSRYFNGHCQRWLSWTMIHEQVSRSQMMTANIFYQNVKTFRFTITIISMIARLHAAQLPQSESDWQIKAQYLSPVVVRRAHWGVALSPFGTSLGQLPWLLHLGLQKSPDSPCTRTASSSDSQPVFGLP